MSAVRTSARSLLIVLLAAWTMAPTPGATGGCGGDSLDGQADVVAYCQEREELGCERRRRRGEIDEEEVVDCRHGVRDLCSRRFWPADCRPTERVARACLNALRAVDTLETPEDELEECQSEAFCAIRTVDAGANP